jgi:TonB family protein
MAVTASLAIHVGVVGAASLTLGRASDTQEPAEHWLEVEMSAGPVSAPVDLPEAIKRALEHTAPLVAPRLPSTPQRAASSPQPRAAAARAPAAQPQAAPARAAAAAESLPRFALGNGATAAPDVPNVQDAVARFVIPASSALYAGHAAPQPSAAGPAIAADETLAANQVSVPAKLVVGPAVPYPPAARAAEVEASVPLEIVIDTRGQVVQARSLEHAGYGLDEAALAAVRSYRFSAAQRSGHAVRVRMRWNMLFRLR